MEQHIEWLKRFIELWDKCEGENGVIKHERWLCDIYLRYLTKHGLPDCSADELQYELMWNDSGRE